MSTAPSVCVCVSTAPGVCVCVCVCVCVSTAPGVCVLGWVKYREHISLLVILCIIVYVEKKNISVSVFFQNRYPIMVKCLNIGKNIDKPIYIGRSLVLSKYCLCNSVFHLVLSLKSVVLDLYLELENML